MDHVSKTVAVVMLARLKRAGYVNHFYKDTMSMSDPLSVRLGPGICYSHVCSTNEPGNFRITKNVLLTIYQSISLWTTRMNIYVYFNYGIIYFKKTCKDWSYRYGQ